MGIGPLARGAIKDTLPWSDHQNVSLNCIKAFKFCGRTALVEWLVPLVAEYAIFSCG
jgi:hypothetical protein